MEIKPLTPNLQPKLDFLIELILVLVLIVTPILFGSVDLFPVTIIELSAFFILFLWFIKAVIKGSIEFVKLPINKPTVLFIIFVLVQYIFINFFVPDFYLGNIYRHKIKSEALKFTSYLIFFYAILNNFSERKKIIKLIYVLIFIGFSLSFLGIIQKLSGAKKIFWISQTPCTEGSFASFPNRNHFANYINMIIFLAFGGLFSYFPLLRDYIKGFNKEDILKGAVITFQKGIWLYIFGLSIMLSALFYSLSRGGVSSFLFGFVIFLILILIKGLTKRGYIAFFLIIAFTFIIANWVNAPKQFMEKLENIKKTKNVATEKDLVTRKGFAYSATKVIKDYPIFGVGFGALEFVYNKRYNPTFVVKEGVNGRRISFYIDHLHNDFLELFCEIGAIGFIIFFITVCLYVSFVLKTFLKRHDPFVVGVGAGAIAGLFSMCAHSFVDFNFHITSNAILFFVIAAIALVISNSHIRGREETSTLLKTKPLFIKGALLRFLMSLVILVAFFNIAMIIIKPYIAYRISEDKQADISKITRAIKLDPLNDKYHFLLARLYIKEAEIRMEKRKEYIDSALKAVEEAIKLNPWNEYYLAYLAWVNNEFKSKKTFFLLKDIQL